MEAQVAQNHPVAPPVFPPPSQEFQMKMETLQQRRDELERKEQQLKESLLKFDKFLKVWDSLAPHGVQ